MMMLMAANLVGFVVGLDGTRFLFVKLFASWEGAQFMVFACICMWVAMQLMFEYRYVGAHAVGVSADHAIERKNCDRGSCGDVRITSHKGISGRIYVNGGPLGNILALNQYNRITHCKLTHYEHWRL
jgi:hypothetical protein